MDSPLAAIVLAAGKSQRMGRLKPLLPFGDRPMLARTVERLIEAGEFAPIIVVTGHAADEIAAALCEFKVQLVRNSNYETGEMLSSVQAGVFALPADAPAFLLLPGDQPMVQTATFRALTAAWPETHAPVIVPTFEGRRGHPVLFSADCRQEILALPVESTLKTCVARHAARRVEVPVPDPAILLDVDTPEDYARALRLWQAQAGRRGVSYAS